MGKSQREKYFSIKQYVVENIQEEDFGSEGPGLLIALRNHSRLSSNRSDNMSVGSNSDYDSAFSPRSDSPKKKRKKKSQGSSGNEQHLGIRSDTRFTLTTKGF